jgi:hypothetical protein
MGRGDVRNSATEEERTKHKPSWAAGEKRRKKALMTFEECRRRGREELSPSVISCG